MHHEIEHARIGDFGVVNLNFVGLCECNRWPQHQQKRNKDSSERLRGVPQ
jgi:hypothetical protein